MPNRATQDNEIHTQLFLTLEHIAVHKPRSLSQLIQGGAPRLQHLSNRAKTALALKESVRTALPSALANHVTAAALRQQELTIWVDSAAFCARLRFETPHVREALSRETGAPIERIRVKVGPEPGRVATPKSSQITGAARHRPKPAVE